ncbi:MAG: hypothetical protein E6G10_25090 [Actinobacteria bacterium]|nr:MAG: hypothetical protein E6G10_25090 [Actinomycetota bacterium]
MDETGVKLVHDFNEASREMSELLGGKGANLAEMTRVVGADRVPGGFNDHDGGLRRLRGRQAPDGLWEQVEQPRGRIVDSCIPHGTSISSTSPSALSCADCRGELDLPTAVGLATPVRKRGAGDLQVRRGRTETHLLCVSAQLLGRYFRRGEQRVDRGGDPFGHDRRSYLNESGPNANLWPGTTFDYRRRTLRFDPAAHLMHRPAATAVPVAA